MDPNNKETPGIQLPPPVEQALPAGSAPAVEQAAPPTGPAVSLPAQPQLQAPIAPTASISQDASTLTVDDDNDLIEKEWVQKAKQIVERNRDDPYKQSEELTLFKADYMKKRYGKTIKISQ